MPGVNTHNFDTVNYMCPYFLSERKNMICCEGLTRNTVNRTCFRRRTDMEKYRVKYCFCYEYARCHWASLLAERKYGDASKQANSQK